ncbi:hypothetical protein BS78_01G104300 [Paspalum vaginatum]|nr:hypothetical protein BS78_01G104300 [Paspalum vaginatum]
MTTTEEDLEDGNNAHGGGSAGGGGGEGADGAIPRSMVGSGEGRCSWRTASGGGAGGRQRAVEGALRPSGGSVAVALGSPVPFLSGNWSGVAGGAPHPGRQWSLEGNGGGGAWRTRGNHPAEMREGDAFLVGCGRRSRWVVGIFFSFIG